MAAPQDQPARRDHAVHALLAGQPRIFFDAVDRHFRGAAEDREHRAIPQEIDRIVAPLAIGDHATVQIQDAIELNAIERYPAWRRTRSGVAHRCASLARIGFLRHRTHGRLLSSERHDRANGARLQGGPWRARPMTARGKIVPGAAWKAPTSTGPFRCAMAHRGRHGIVSAIIIPPHFRQPTAVLDCDKTILRWPGPFGSGFLSPQPPGAVGIGPVSQDRLTPHWANESWSFFFWGDGFFSGAERPSLPGTPVARPRASGNGETDNQWVAELSGVKAAPSITPGLSRLPSWT